MSATVIAVVLVILIGLVVFGAVKVMLWRKNNADYVQMGKDVLERARKEGLYGDENIRSVSNATSIYLPKIQRDFPEFSWSEQRQRAFQVLKAYLLALGGHDVSLLPDCVNETLRAQVATAIADDEAGGIRTLFDDVTVHDVEIVDYVHQAGTCTVVLDASAGFRSWQEKDGELYLGSRTQFKQTCFCMELIYVQDPDKVPDDEVATLGLTCPNCGGVIRSLGQKHCEYCGSAIVELDLMVWHFGAITMRDEEARHSG